MLTDDEPKTAVICIAGQNGQPVDKPVDVVSHHGTWCVARSRHDLTSSETFVVMHKPTGNAVYWVYSRTSAIMSMRLLDETWGRELAWQAQSAKKPDGYDESLAWLEEQGCLHVRPGETIYDALDRIGIVVDDLDDADLDDDTEED